MEVKLYSIKNRPSKVSIKDFVSLEKIKKSKLDSFFKGLPKILRAKDLNEFINEIVKRRKKGKEFILMMGAHPIKCGLSPLIIDLMKRRIVTHIATNGASVIHDFEISFIGKTSEDVAKQLPKGKFGMVKETLIFINEAVKRGAENNEGLGECIGRFIKEKNLKFKKYSIFYNAYKNIPITVHVGIGTDIIYQSPNCDGSSWGKTSYNDFLKLVDKIKKLEGGIVMNLGSAVMMPEVFLKALNLARNQGYKIKNFISANSDQILHYRVKENILNRPGGKIYNFICQHEIIFPLVYKGIIEKWKD